MTTRTPTIADVHALDGEAKRKKIRTGIRKKIEPYGDSWTSLTVLLPVGIAGAPFASSSSTFLGVDTCVYVGEEGRCVGVW